jgi:hypothetical protein
MEMEQRSAARRVRARARTDARMLASFVSREALPDLRADPLRRTRR